MVGDEARIKVPEALTDNPFTPVPVRAVEVTPVSIVNVVEFEVNVTGPVELFKLAVPLPVADNVKLAFPVPADKETLVAAGADMVPFETSTVVPSIVFPVPLPDKVVD